MDSGNKVKSRRMDGGIDLLEMRERTEDLRGEDMRRMVERGERGWEGVEGRISRVTRCF